jgi:hypothetical protein
MSQQTEPLPVIGAQLAKGTAAKAQCFLQQCAEDRREVAGGAVDDLQYLGGRGLLLQRLARLGQQPRVFHRDHRLVSKSSDQLDLLLAERLHPLTRKNDHTDQRPLARQRHAKLCMDIAQRDRFGQPVFRIGGDVQNVNRPALQCDASSERSAAGRLASAPRTTHTATPQHR